MTSKKIIIHAMATFLLCFFTHFVYTLFPNTFFSIFFPVNESIWEHMKMIYTTILLYGIIDSFVVYKYNEPKNNFILILFGKAIFAILLYLSIYLPFYFRFGEHMFFTLFLLFITLLISTYLEYKARELPSIRYANAVGIFLIILGFLLFGYFTYKPIHSSLFFDPQAEKYGKNEYLSS